MVCLFIVCFEEGANRLAEAHVLLEAVVDSDIFGLACLHVVDVVVFNCIRVLEQNRVKLTRILEINY